MELNVWHAPKKEEIPDTPYNFLKKVEKPTAIHIPGKNTNRTRVLVTLTHGNEPSGLQAVHEWLRWGRIPLVNIVVILGSVKAALTDPVFFYRHLPGERDLN
ncbi:MAG: hypothetical protein OXB84_08800 [Halobacteriovoraceae bacterium]|nr:hypothetical protein [Halobacteriovoraceae bacterium]